MGEVHEKTNGVAIVGGGPGGLTLARLLQMRGVRVRVFEADRSPDERNQGGSLDLHEDSGQRALREAGLFHRFAGVARPEGQAATVMDKHGVVRLRMRAEDEEGIQPEIDRGALRTLLLDSLDPGTVVWDRRLIRVEPEAGGAHRLVFACGEPVSADLVIGCDGVRSKVRPLVSSIAPRYAGVTFVETRLSGPDERHPDVARLVGPGSLLALGDDKGILAQRNGDGHIRVYAALRVPEDFTTRGDIDFAQPAGAREGLLGFFAGWAPEIVAMLRHADDVFTPRPLFTLPPDQAWAPRASVTLLGDAAHVMPPFTGRGANEAMLDAVELAHALTSGEHADVASALHAYETAMLARMSEAIASTLATQELTIAPDAPDGLVAAIQAAR